MWKEYSTVKVVNIIFFFCKKIEEWDLNTVQNCLIVFISIQFKHEIKFINARMTFFRIIKKFHWYSEKSSKNAAIKFLLCPPPCLKHTYHMLSKVPPILPIQLAPSPAFILYMQYILYIYVDPSTHVQWCLMCKQWRK